MSGAATLRTIRLVSGLLLTEFVAGHLVSLAAGLVSLEALSDVSAVLMGLWGNAVGDMVLTGAAAIHLLLGLQAIAARRSLTLRRSDAVQIALGLAIVPLLTPHVLTVSVARSLAPAFEISFPTLLAFYWLKAPTYAIQQLTVVVIIWTHASIGLFGWMSLQRWWTRAGAFVTPLLFAIPILALLGFVEAGKDVIALVDTDPAFAAEVDARWALLQSVQPELMRIRTIVLIVYGLAIAVALAVLAMRLMANRSRPVTVAYDGALEGHGRRGLTILEISRLSRVPHASLCSGRGRCGTCRVRVVGGTDGLTAMDEVERWTLGAARGDASVRLACRARVVDEGVEVVRLLPPDADASAARRPGDWIVPATPPPGEPDGASADGAAAPAAAEARA